MGLGALGIVGAVGTGLSGLGGRKESQSYNKAAKKREGLALGELTPEAMQSLIRALFTHYYSQLMPQMMGAQQGLGAAAARSGLTGAGAVQQLRAGIPGQFAGKALGQAVPSALGIAGQRAGIRAGTPFQIGKSGMGIIGDMLQSFASMGGLGAGFPSGPAQQAGGQQTANSFSQQFPAGYNWPSGITGGLGGR